MNKNYLIACVVMLALLSACEQQQAPQTEQAVETAAPDAAIDSTPKGMVLPATTSSDTARAQYMAGWADFENARYSTANEKFLQAAATDPAFAMAHMMAGISGASTEAFIAGLKNASDTMGDASKAEQLLIGSWQQAFDANIQGSIESRLEVTKLHPDSPRAWMFLGNAYSNVRKTKEARAAYLKAVGLAPEMVLAHTSLGNSLMTQDPKDFAAAEQHFMHAVAITPNEPNPHDLLGDVHRAQNNLRAAYDDYSKAAELAPELGSAYQQRGHVNSFLGKYDEARADYARAAQLEDARGSNNGGYFMLYHAYVSVYEGDTAAAIAELRALAASASEAYTEGVIDFQVNALSNAALFATESGDSEAASAIIEEAAALMREQAIELGSEEFSVTQEASIAYLQGLLAARMGDAENAAAKAKEFEHYVAPSSNPRKLEQMHAILGLSAYYQGDFASAVEHLSAGDNQNNMVNKYYLAKANESAGNADQAAQLFSELAVYNFNSPGFALFRKKILNSVAAD